MPEWSDPAIFHVSKITIGPYITIDEYCSYRTIKIEGKGKSIFLSFHAVFDQSGKTLVNDIPVVFGDVRRD